MSCCCCCCCSQCAPLNCRQIMLMAMIGLLFVVRSPLLATTERNSQLPIWQVNRNPSSSHDTYRALDLIVIPSLNHASQFGQLLKVLNQGIPISWSNCVVVGDEREEGQEHKRVKYQHTMSSMNEIKTNEQRKMLRIPVVLFHGQSTRTIDNFFVGLPTDRAPWSSPHFFPPATHSLG